MHVPRKWPGRPGAQAMAVAVILCVTDTAVVFWMEKYLARSRREQKRLYRQLQSLHAIWVDEEH